MENMSGSSSMSVLLWQPILLWLTPFTVKAFNFQQCALQYSRPGYSAVKGWEITDDLFNKSLGWTWNHHLSISFFKAWWFAGNVHEIQSVFESFWGVQGVFILSPWWSPLPVALRHFILLVSGLHLAIMHGSLTLVFFTLDYTPQRQSHCLLHVSIIFTMSKCMPAASPVVFSSSRLKEKEADDIPTSHSSGSGENLSSFLLSFFDEMEENNDLNVLCWSDNSVEFEAEKFIPKKHIALTSKYLIRTESSLWSQRENLCIHLKTDCSLCIFLFISISWYE